MEESRESGLRLGRSDDYVSGSQLTTPVHRLVIRSKDTELLRLVWSDLGSAESTAADQEHWRRGAVLLVSHRGGGAGCGGGGGDGTDP